MEIYTGLIKQVRYYNEETKFVVALIHEEEIEQDIWVTGLIQHLDLHLRYRFYGDFMVHPKYGRQFKFNRYEELLANDEDEIIRYLSSKLFKGIGKVQATHIVEALGDHAIEIIKADIDALDHIQGMNQTKKEAIQSVLLSQDQEVFQFLMSHGVSTHWIEKIWVTYQEKAIDVIHTFPYQLLEDIDGIPFKMVDELALNIGIDQHDSNRIQSVIYYSIKEYCFKTGNTYIHENDLFPYVLKYEQEMNMAEGQLAIQGLIENKKIYLHDSKIFVDIYEEAEQHIAQILENFLSIPKKEYAQDKLDRCIQNVEEKEHIQFDLQQKEAICQFMRSPLMILTGGPGTGKTTIVKGAIRVFNQLEEHCHIALAAPTGRAAKRLSEITDMEAQTIHRLLKWDIQKNEFMCDENHPLDVSLLIIDEFSMVDTILFSKLLLACRHVEKILIIGDHEQLPSVSPGNVLRDLLKIEHLPIIRLEKIYRQKETSGIIKLAHAIRLNEWYEPFDFDKYKDIHFMECQNMQVLSLTKKIVEKALAEGYLNTEIQVLAPMYQGIAGIDALNSMLQDVINPKTEFHHEIRIGQKVYREGDKILQLKNRVDDNVFNGDIGILVEIRFKDRIETMEDTIVVDYDGNFVEYTPADFNSFTLAYCTSIHKAQGSEFKIVIMPVLFDYHIMLQKKLLYTGITRAKQSLFILGEKRAFYRGISNTLQKERQTYLVHRFQNNHQQDEISPYDFME